MKKLSHLALFFSHAVPNSIGWVRAPIWQHELCQKRIDDLVRIVLLQRDTYTFLLHGETEYIVDEEYFKSEGASKKLVYVNDCHLRAFAEAFGEATNAIDDSFVTRNCLKFGRIDSGIFTPCEPMVVTRIYVTPTSIPGTLSELDNVLIRSVTQLGFK